MTRTTDIRIPPLTKDNSWRVRLVPIDSGFIRGTVKVK